MTRLEPAQWAEVRVLYEDSESTVLQIAQQFGVAERTIFDRAKRESWRRRSQTLGQAVGTQGPDAPVPPGHPTKAVRQALIRRLYKAIDMKLKHWEDRMARGEVLSASDSERMAKEVTTMIGGFEKVAEAEGAIEKRDALSAATGPAAGRRGAGRARVAAESAESDAERMRREIAARLERLQAGSGAEGGAERADG